MGITSQYLELVVLKGESTFELTEEHLYLGSIIIDRKTNIYFKRGELGNYTAYKTLPKSDLKILIRLLEGFGSVVSHEDLFCTGWGDKIVSTSSICVTIHHIRHILKFAQVDKKIKLKNFTGVGYGLFKNYDKD